MNWFFTKTLKWIGNKMEGKKTYAGAAGKALVGLGPLIAGIVGLIGIAFPDQGLPDMEIETALGMITAGCYAISSGMASFGVGKKLDKEAVQIETATGVPSGVTGQFEETDPNRNGP